MDGRARGGRPRWWLVLIVLGAQALFLFACYQLTRAWAVPGRVVLDDAIASPGGAALSRLEVLEDLPPLLRSDLDDWTVELEPASGESGDGSRDLPVLRGRPNEEGRITFEGPAPSEAGRYPYHAHIREDGTAHESDIVLDVVPAGRDLVLVSLEDLRAPFAEPPLVAVRLRAALRALREIAKDHTVVWVDVEPWPDAAAVRAWLAESDAPPGPLIFLGVPAYEVKWIYRALRDWLEPAVRADLRARVAVTSDPAFAKAAGEAGLRALLVAPGKAEGYVAGGVARVDSWDDVPARMAEP